MTTETSAPSGPLLVSASASPCQCPAMASHRSVTCERRSCKDVALDLLPLLDAEMLTTWKLHEHWSDNLTQLMLSRSVSGRASVQAVVAAAGITVAFNGPISGMAFIAEESAANLGGPVFYRALFGNCIALLVFNILSVAYNTQGYFWNTR